MPELVAAAIEVAGVYAAEAGAIEAGFYLIGNSAFLASTPCIFAGAPMPPAPTQSEPNAMGRSHDVSD